MACLPKSEIEADHPIHNRRPMTWTFQIVDLAVPADNEMKIRKGDN